MARQRKTFNEINITPLTDIFLVLLIIMMVIAPLLDQQGLNLTVPEMVTQEMHDQKETKVMEFSVTNDNRYFFDGNEVVAKDLEKLISSSLKEYKDGMMIRVDDNAEHGVVVKLMDSARNAGMTSISVTGL